jgi:hypothetical protein
MQMRVAAAIEDAPDDIAPVDHLAAAHAGVVEVPVSGPDVGAIPQQVLDHHDVTFGAGVLGPHDHAVGHCRHRRSGCQTRHNLPTRIEREPVLAGVIQFVEWHAVAVAIDEASTRFIQSWVLHAKARIDVERASQGVYVWAEAHRIEREIKMVGWNRRDRWQSG